MAPVLSALPGLVFLIKNILNSGSINLLHCLYHIDSAALRPAQPYFSLE